MQQQEQQQECCQPLANSEQCCRVEAVIGIDERGQMVLPKEVREKAGIRAGDKLAVVAMQKDGETCCLTIIKAEKLAGMVKDLLGPVMSEIINKQDG